MKTVPGSARTMLLAALALAAVVLVGSVAIIAVSSRSGGVPSEEEEEADDEESDDGITVGVHLPKRTRTSAEPGEIEDDDGIFYVDVPEGTRKPEGEEFQVDAETLRAVFGARHWEEIRRQIDVLQSMGQPVPPDIVKALMAMLGKDDTRLDAVLALGQVKDDATGRALAELASSKEATPETRAAALQALAQSGQSSALPYLQRLVGDAGLEDPVMRGALRAVAGIGGPDAMRTLLDMFAAHSDSTDALHDAIVDALGRAENADEGLAAAIRAARSKGDRDALMAVMRASLIQGEKIGPEVEGELLRMIESPDSMSSFADEEQRESLRLAAMPSAVAAGLVEPVLRIATTSGAGAARDNALNALRQARGDVAARQIAEEIARATDDTVRRDLTVALGSTASFAATATLVRLLDDPSDNVRHAASYGLGQIRDPAAVKPILAHLTKAPPDDMFAQNLIVALGTIGVHDALPLLEKLLASEEEFWRQLRPRTQNAIVRIKTGNPESLRLK